MSENTSSNLGTIQWFPGHMTKTFRVMEKEIKNIDVVIILLDARIPYSSQNPEVEKLIKNKPRIYILNKRDLADENITNQWIKHFKSNGMGAIAINSKTGKNSKVIVDKVHAELSELLERREKRGIEKLKITAMMVGIPNVGKSTFINSLAGTRRAKAQDKPGVTRGKQWVTVGDLDLLDMPGVLWPKFENQNVAANLAFIGSIKDDVLDIEELAVALISELKEIYPELLKDRYKLLPGGVENTERASIMLCDEFRGSKMGRISLERPSENE